MDKTKCPYCNYTTDSHRSMDIHEDSPHSKLPVLPKSGDLSFCLNCCNPQIFDDDLKLQKIDLKTLDLTKEEIFAFEDLQRVHNEMKDKGELDDLEGMK